MKKISILVCVFLINTIIFGQEKLSLEQAIKIALQNNSQLKQAQYQYEVAQTDILASYSNILPDISADVSYSKFSAGGSETERFGPVGIDLTTGRFIYAKEKIPAKQYSLDNYSLSTNLRQNIYDGGRWWDNMQKAKINKNSSEASLVNAKQFIILNVMQRYYELLKTQKLLGVYEEAVKISEGQVAKAQSMFAVGSVTKGDVYKAQVALGNDKINYIYQKNAVEIARTNLNDALGRDVNTPVEIEEVLDIKKDYGELTGLIESAQKENPNLKKLNFDLNASELNIKIAKSGYLPNLGLNFSYNRDNVEFKKVFGNFSEEWKTNLSVGLSYNIFNGFQTKTGLEKAYIGFRSAQESLNQEKRTVSSEVKQAYLNWKALLEIIEINDNNVKSAEEDFRLATERYAVGATTELERREAQLNLVRAKATFVRAQYDAMVAQAQLEKAMGKLKTEW
jgi:TolC family type I secretion outer membrane protein